MSLKSLNIIGVILLFASVFLIGCKKDFNGYYDVPSNLAGPIYEQLKSDPDFSEFVLAIDKFPKLKEDINTSGLYTVFAPTNEAIKSYLASKFPAKKSMADFNISIEADSLALNEFVQIHIMFNMYFEYDFNHAVDILTKPNPLGPRVSGDTYRFATRYKDSPYYYYDKTYKRERLIAPNNKVVTVYSKNYLDKYNLESDYQSFFGETPSDFNIDWAQVVKKDIAAKNGVIQGINRVLERLPYMDELIQQKNPEYYNLLGQFMVLETDGTIDSKTKDTVFYKNYGGVLLGSDNAEFTILSPNGTSFLNFINGQVLPGFDNSYDSIHQFTAALILNNYIISSYTNSSNLQKQAINFNNDTLKNLSFIGKSRASNGVLYTISDNIISPAFNSVAKPALLNKKYSYFLNLLTSRVVNGSPNYLYTNNIDYLKNPNRSFTLIIPSNDAFLYAGITWAKDYKGNYDFFQGGARLLQSQKDSIMNSLIIPNVNVTPSDMDYKWVATRGDNFMLFKNGKIQGGVDYLSAELTGNGYAYTTEELPARPYQPVGNLLLGRNGYKIFVDSILSKQTWNGSQTFLSLLQNVDGINSYTVLIPSDDVLNQYKTDNSRGSFAKDTIWKFIAAYHIIKTKVFGDGTFLRKAGNPISGDDSKFLTLFTKDVYNSLFIKDVQAWVQFDFSGGSKIVTSEKGVSVNITSPFDIQGSNGVIHAVDNLLLPPDKIYH